MTHHFKTREYFIIAVVILIFILPQVSAAEERIPDGKLCSELPRFKTSVSTALTLRGAKLATLKDDRLKSLEAAWKSEESGKEAERSVADMKRKDHFDNLITKAKTDAEKVAIQKFQTAVEAAVTARREAIDKAFQVYKTGVSSLIENKMKNVGTLKTNYAKSLDTAFANATLSCGKGTNKMAIREKMKGALHEIENKYQENKNGAVDVSTDMRSLAKTRREAIESAEALFKQALSEASATLNIAR